MSNRKSKKDQDSANASPGEIVERAESGEPEGRLTETAEESSAHAEPQLSAPATETATPPPPAADRRGVELPRHWPATLLILVVAAFLIGGLAAYWPQLSGQAGDDRIDALEARLAELTAASETPAAAAGIPAAVQRRVESIETRLGTLERNAPAIFNERAGATLDQRVTALETGRAETGQAMSALVARLATVEAATPADLPQRLASMASGAALANVEQRVSQLEALRHAAAVLALARLARAADEARPYLREFRALQTVAPEDPSIPVLEPHAESGIPTVAMLAARFPDAARTAISAERTGMADGFWSRLWARFRNTVSIRRIALGPGDDSESRLARAQTALGEDNLAGAVEEVAALEGDAATAIAPWLRQARARLAIDRAITEMDERVTQVLALRAPAQPVVPEVPAAPAGARKRRTCGSGKACCAGTRKSCTGRAATMIRLLVILIVAGLIGTGIARLVDTPGGFDFVIGSYEIHAGVAAAVVLLICTVIVLFLLTRLAVAVLTAPRRVRGWVRDRRARRGFQALSRGLVAARAGDHLEARRFARRGEMLLGNTPLGLLLVAEAAQLEGNEEKQGSTYKSMLNYPDTEILGLRGLFQQAMRRGDEQEAVALANRAFELRTRTPWAAQALFELHASRHEWDQAQNVLKKQLRAKLINPDVARRRRAVALTGAGIDAERAGNSEAALESALEAVTMAPALIPAAVLAARKLTQAGRVWKAQDVIETAWSQSPHPDLASAYAGVHPTHDALTRARRMENLVKLNPTHVESRLLVAEQAMALGQWHDARAALEPLTQGYPTARACVMMAEIAQQERGDVTAAQGWLARASRAPRDAQWRCARCGFVAQEWSATCNNCGVFDTLSWTSPQMESAPPPQAAAAAAAYTPPRVVEREPAAQMQATRPREERAMLARPPDDPGATMFEEAEEEYTADPFAVEDTPEGPVRRRTR